MIRIFVASLALCFVLPQIAQANRAAVKCVQAQVNALDYNAGSVDGVMGVKTRAAYRKLISENENVKFATRLTSANAIVLCRELGLWKTELRAIWPSSVKRFNTNFHPSLSQETRQIISDSISQALGKLENQFNIVLAGRFDVLAAIEDIDMRRAVEKSVGHRIDRKSLLQFMNNTCPETIKLGGFAGRNYVGICFPQGDIDVKKSSASGTKTGNPNRDLLNEIAFHEVVHAVQRQLAGVSGISSETEKLGKMGPEWLVEGVAQYISIRGLAPEMSIGVWMKALKTVAGGHSADISKFNTYGARKDHRDTLYVQGLLASHYLSVLVGEQALLDFYRRIGFGAPWEIAFTDSFGVTPKQFYAMFAAS